MTGSLRRKLDFAVGVPLIGALSLFRKRPAPVPFKIHKILVIKLAAVGDTILLLPVLRALHKALPGSSIDWLVSSVNAEMASVTSFHTRALIMPCLTPWSLGSLIKRLRRERYDLVIDFEQWARGTAILSSLIGAKRTLGFQTPRQHRSALYSDTVTKSFDRHEIEDFFALASKAVPLIPDMTPLLEETGEGLNELRLKAPSLFDAGPTVWTVLLHPGCGSDGYPREWLVERYIELGRWLRSTFNARLMLSGGPEETINAQAVATGVGNVVNLAGLLSWKATISLVKRADLLVSGNTGVMHIAAALQKPQIALHGPTDPGLWGPLNPRAVVIKTSCPGCPSLKLGFEYHRYDQSCMARIPVDQVMDAVRKCRECDTALH